MSATAPAGLPLELILRRAGAVITTRGTRPVVAHFGSAAAELAVCVRGVGLVERSDLSTLVLQAPPAQLSALMTRLAGAIVSPGGLVSGGGAWWCGEAPDRVIVVCDQRTGGRLVDALHADAARHVAVGGDPREPAVIGLLGRHTGKVLAALGVYGQARDPRQARPFGRASIDGIATSWVLQSDRQALALVPREHAGEVWLSIERRGRPFGISCVGDEAASRYALMERLRAATPASL